MRWRRKQVCADCHFLVKRSALPTGVVATFVLEGQERERVRAADYSTLGDHWSLGCDFGVWDEATGLDAVTKRETLSVMDRRGFCFFWPFRRGMLLPAAKTLQEREARDRDSARDRRLTIVGLWLAAIALACQAYLTVADKRGWPPFRSPPVQSIP